jgi:hypothetical protein
MEMDREKILYWTQIRAQSTRSVNKGSHSGNLKAACVQEEAPFSISAFKFQ